MDAGVGMANEEQVAILRKGAEAWHLWRRHATQHSVDLRNGDLRDANLSHVNLNNTDLTGADMSKAILAGAILSSANLTSANLTDAVLTAAILTRADLIKTILSGANLTGVTLTNANLTGVDLSEADLTDAVLQDTVISRAILLKTVFSHSHWSRTIIANVNLSVAIGLESVVHLGPSSIARDTMLLSKGKLPDVLLRGCGFSDWEIEAARLYDPTLSPNEINDIQYRVFQLRAGAPIQVGSVFISYAHGDSGFVKALEGKLSEKGIRYWRDVHHATAGRLDKVVDRAMRLNPTVLLILSKNSVESDWVENEATRARKLEKERGQHVLCPIALDDSWKDCDWSAPLRTQIEKYNILPFSDWQDESAMTKMFRRLVDGLSIFYGSAAGNG
jgi:hypothetical protein